jgi:hypothetical protein
MTPADLARVGALIAQPAQVAGQPFGFGVATKMATTPSAKVAESMPECSQKVAGGGAATSASGTATAASPEAARAAALFVAGSSPADVVRELRGVRSNEGARYQSALAEVLDLIRQGVKGA